MCLGFRVSSGRKWYKRSAWVPVDLGVDQTEEAMFQRCLVAADIDDGLDLLICDLAPY